MNERIKFGTCSWKYDSWRGLIYPEQGELNYLHEYSTYYNCVEVDQWFWSLFSGDKVVLPKPEVVREYGASVPDDFLFAIKVPNSITLTHHYNRDKNLPLQSNPYFLSSDLFNRFLDTLEPLQGRIGPLMFQFEYLNKKKMSSLGEFIDRFGSFLETVPKQFTYCLELRNPNYLTAHYFRFLESANLFHVFLHGYYMPSIFELYRNYKGFLSGTTVVRLLGPDRKKIEQQAGKRWNQIIDPKEKDLKNLKKMLLELSSKGVQAFVLVNNHFEGSAPRTISRIMAMLEQAP